MPRTNAIDLNGKEKKPAKKQADTKKKPAKKAAAKQAAQKQPEGSISRKALIAALLKIKPGLSKKEIIEQSTHFIFEADTIWTYNDNLTISQSLKSGFKGAIKADEFYNLLNKIPDEFIFIESEKEKQITMTANNKEAVIAIDTEIKIQKPKMPAQKAWAKLPENFSKAIKFCAFSCGQNQARPELTCIFLAQNYAMSCDGFRATRKELTEKIKTAFLIPGDSAMQLSNYNPDKFSIGQHGWLHFSNKEKTVFSCRTIDHKFPDAISNLFKVDGEPIKLPKSFFDAVDSAQTVLTDDYNSERSVQVNIANGKLTVKGRSKMMQFRQFFKIDHHDFEKEFFVQPDFLMDILKHLSEMTIGETFLFFKGDDFEHVINQSSE